MNEPDRPLFVRTAGRALSAAHHAPGEAPAARLLPAPEEQAALSRIAALAARLLGTSSAQVSLLTDVQVVAGGAGLPPGAVGSSGPLEESLCTVTAGLGEPLLVSDARLDRRVQTLPPVTSGQVGAYLGVPLFSDAGDVVGSLCAFDATPRGWTEVEARILEELADFMRAELEVAALSRGVDPNRQRWDLAAAAGEMGSFDWDLVTGELIWDDRLIAMYGYDEGDVGFDRSIASVEARVHPDDAAMVDAVMSEAIADVAPLQVLYRILLPGDRVRWLEARGRALAGPDGVAARLIGVSWDVTAEQDIEQRADRVLASMNVGYVAVDADWRVRYVNTKGSKLLGMEPGEVLGQSLWELFPDAVGSVFDHAYRRVAQTKQPEVLEAYYPAPLNAWYEVQVSPESGGIALYFLDITERRRTVELLQLSTDVSARLVGAVSREDALAALAELMVPTLADWSIVWLIEEASIRDIHSWHADPALRPVVEQYATSRSSRRVLSVLDQVARTREPFAIDSGALELGLRGLTSEAAKQALTALAPESAVTVPLMAGGRVLGGLSLGRGADRPPVSARELEITIDLCRRTGLAIDNARLVAKQAVAAAHHRTVAETLQRALLTTLPEPDHLSLAARYLTAADEEQVGGDWYDAVVQPGGATTIMIGDVVGHDIAAAALMGQLRTMLRMLALQQDDPPSKMLSDLDQSAERLKVGAMATVLTARIEQSADDDSGDDRTLRWSNAGHPPPLLVDARGVVEVLTGDHYNLMIGVKSDVARADFTQQIPPGSTLLLYTDGLIERVDQGIDQGIDRLADALGRHHRLPPGDLLDQILHDLVGASPTDDVAVLAVHFGSEQPG